MIKLENGIKALCIQHSGADKLAAANLFVNVGGLEDPRKIKGLSHFLEHMLFLGSEKFPTEDEFAKLIQSNGGETNATTSFSETTYSFDIIEDEFENAFEQFAAMATAPILSRDGVDREVNAVESEFQKSFIEDGIRLFHFFGKFVENEHPANLFLL